MFGTDWDSLSHASAFGGGVILGASFTILIMRIITRYFSTRHEGERHE